MTDMIITEPDSREERVLRIAGEMMTAARTAPKACGVDHLEIATLSQPDIERLAERMRELAEDAERSFFVRDADNIAMSQAVVLIGVRTEVRGLDCGLCGYLSCRAKAEAPSVPCAFDSLDLGIAVGAATSVAADCRGDNRVMYSAGVAATDLEMLPGCRTIVAIPLSVSGKNIFFDRKASGSAVK